MSESKTVHMHIYDPNQPALFGKRRRSDRAQCHTVTCTADRCELRDAGKCECRVVLGRGRCPYGTYRVTSGYTPRARAYYDWIAERRKQHAGVPSLYFAGKHGLAVVGDYVYLPYCPLCFKDGKLNQQDLMSSGFQFLLLDAFDSEMVAKIAAWRPRALFTGGEITSFQSEDVPLFVQHVSERMPDLWAHAVEAHPWLAEKLAATSPVGRRAKLHTLTTHKGTFNSGSRHAGRDEWTWDGEFLTCESTSVLGSPLRLGIKHEVRIRPPEGAEVTITDAGQVNEGTEFTS